MPLHPVTRSLLIGLGISSYLICAAVAGLVYLGFLFGGSSGSVSTRSQVSAIDCIETWGRLAPLPRSAQQLEIKQSGSRFTRGFQATFYAPQPDIDQWLKASPGIKDAMEIGIPPSSRHFEIKPGGGAVRAQVEVDDESHRVSIDVHWS